MTETMLTITADRLTIDHLQVEDPLVIDVVSRQDPSQRLGLLNRMLAVGARGLASMGMGLSLGDIDRRVKASVDDALAEGRRQVADTLEELHLAVAGTLDPDQRASIISRCLAELDGFRRALVEAVDPSRADSHTAKLLREVTAMLGAGGALEERLRVALDPANDASALGHSLRRLEERLDDLHRAVSEERGRTAEADRGTAKGFGYEDEVEERLRAWARPVGAVIERTSASEGKVGSDLVGDFVVSLPNGVRIVVEAKHQASISLNGSTGILAEMRRAIGNRGADAAVCLSRSAAFPIEVGCLGIYGDTVLAVDDGEGTLLWAAMVLATRHVDATRRGVDGIDATLISERLERIRSLAGQLSSSKRALTDIVASVEKVRQGLDGVRLDLLEAVSDIQITARHDAQVLPLPAGDRMTSIG